MSFDNQFIPLPAPSINPSIKLKLGVGYREVFVPATPELINAIFVDGDADVEVKLVWKVQKPDSIPTTQKLPTRNRQITESE
jgi:hypothetical protein